MFEEIEITEEQLAEKKLLLLDMMKYIDSFCNDHGIGYALGYGSAIGAVRHHGFIPWDDDIDIFMHIDDFRKFEKFWYKDGDRQNYFLQTKKADPNRPGVFPRLRKNNTASMDPRAVDIPLHWGIPIDIYVYFNAPKNKFLQKLISKWFINVRKDFDYSFKCHSTSGILSKKYHNAKALTAYKFAIILNWFFRKSGKIAYVEHRVTYENSDVFKPYKKIEFENTELYTLNKVEKHLMREFGDFMQLPPEEDRIIHPYGLLDIANDFSKYVEYDTSYLKRDI